MYAFNEMVKKTIASVAWVKCQVGAAKLYPPYKKNLCISECAERPALQKKNGQLKPLNYKTPPCPEKSPDCPILPLYASIDYT